MSGTLSSGMGRCADVYRRGMGEKYSACATDDPCGDCSSSIVVVVVVVTAGESSTCFGTSDLGVESDPLPLSISKAPSPIALLFAFCLSSSPMCAPLFSSGIEVGGFVAGALTSFADSTDVTESGCVMIRNGSQCV
jgi:hypothetical protein